MEEELRRLQAEALARLEELSQSEELEEFRIKYLGRKGEVIQMLSQIGKLSREEKPQAGQLANKIKKEVTAAFEQMKKTLSKAEQEKTKELIDVTLPGIAPKIGKTHVITQTVNELLEMLGDEHQGSIVQIAKEMKDGVIAEAYRGAMAPFMPRADDEELDLYMEEASEALAEKEKWKALKKLLKARFTLLNPGGSMDEWIEDQMDSLK